MKQIQEETGMKERKKEGNLHVKPKSARTSCHRLLCFEKPYMGLKMQQDYEKKKEVKKGRTKIHCVVLNVPPLTEGTWENSRRSPLFSLFSCSPQNSLDLVHFAWTHLSWPSSSLLVTILEGNHSGEHETRQFKSCQATWNSPLLVSCSLLPLSKAIVRMAPLSPSNLDLQTRLDPALRVRFEDNQVSITQERRERMKEKARALTEACHIPRARSWASFCVQADQI